MFFFWTHCRWRSGNCKNSAWPPSYVSTPHFSCPYSCTSLRRLRQQLHCVNATCNWMCNWPTAPMLPALVPHAGCRGPWHRATRGPHARDSGHICQHWGRICIIDATVAHSVACLVYTMQLSVQLTPTIALTVAPTVASCIQTIAPTVVPMIASCKRRLMVNSQHCFVYF